MFTLHPSSSEMPSLKGFERYQLLVAQQKNFMAFEHFEEFLLTS